MAETTSVVIVTGVRRDIFSSHADNILRSHQNRAELLLEAADSPDSRHPGLPIHINTPEIEQKFHAQS